MLVYKIFICFLAGMGAGLGTGFAGMSAAAVISPMLTTFLNMDPYLAVGIALASDVLASAVSAYTYGKNKNLDIKNGIIISSTVSSATKIGDKIANILYCPTNFVSFLIIFITVLTLCILMRQHFNVV